MRMCRPSLKVAFAYSVFLTPRPQRSNERKGEREEKSKKYLKLVSNLYCSTAPRCGHN